MLLHFDPLLSYNTLNSTHHNVHGSWWHHRIQPGNSWQLWVTYLCVWLKRDIRVCYCQSQMLNLQTFLSEALLLLPWGNWWCLGRTRVACHSECSLMLPEPQYRVPKCAGLVSQVPLESRVNISVIGMLLFFLLHIFHFLLQVRG